MRPVGCQQQRDADEGEGPLRKLREEKGQQRCLQEWRCGSCCRSWVSSPCAAPPAQLSPLHQQTSKQPGRFNGNTSSGMTNLENTSCLGEKAAKRKAQLASISTAGGCLSCLPGVRGSVSARTRARGERPSSGVPEGLCFPLLKEPALQFLRWISSLASHCDLAAS